MEKNTIIPKISVDIITGFKSSGKTSLINIFLQESFKNQKVSVFVNEQGNTHHAKNCQLHTVLGGCLCCTAQSDLVASISKAISLESPDRIIIELSGKGDIQDILHIFLYLPKCCLGQLIYILDIRKWNAFFSIMGNFFPKQIKNAPVILLNHWDELSAEEQHSSYAQICNLAPEALLLYDFSDVNPEKIQAFCQQHIPLPSEKNIPQKAVQIRFPGR